MELERYQLIGGEGVGGSVRSAILAPGQVFHRRLISSTLKSSELSRRELEPPREESTKGSKLVECQMNGSSTLDGPMRDRMAPGSKLGHCVNCFLGVAVRILIVAVFVHLERTPPFKRKIHPEELWLYKNPPTNDYVPASILLPASFVVPFTIICLNFLIVHDRHDFVQGISALTLSLGVNGLLTSLLKVTVGRPRPDFFYRCYPDGKMLDDDFACTGDARIVNEGRRSFPSGHASFAFAGFGFVFLYLAAKLHVFNERGRGQAWRLCVAVTPLVVALLVAISRTCDYHHHWQDVTVGSMLGIFVTYVAYRQYFPSIFGTSCHRPYTSRTVQVANCCITSVTEDGEQKPLIGEEKETKWI